eukprot:scaffold1006_cov408-Prasinococcus_capsulatus_cf.AAC.12
MSHDSVEKKGPLRNGKQLYKLWRTPFEIDARYEPIRVIGKGAYGVVCSALDKETNAKVAIKKITGAFENVTDARRTLREIKVLKHLKHENVIALVDVMLPDSLEGFDDIYLVYELMDTDLQHIIKSPQVLSDDHCQYFVYQLLRGIKYIHSARVLHRDLKPPNLLLNASCDLKICDFGLARTSSDKIKTEYVVTRWYRAPELLLVCDDYHEAIDVWSIGCIFAEILVRSIRPRYLSLKFCIAPDAPHEAVMGHQGRKPLFPGKDYLNQLKLIFGILGTPTSEDLVGRQPCMLPARWPYGTQNSVGMGSGIHLKPPGPKVYPGSAPSDVRAVRKSLPNCKSRSN